jgi:hypothetical protein
VVEPVCSAVLVVVAVGVVAGLFINEKKPVVGAVVDCLNGDCSEVDFAESVVVVVSAAGLATVVVAVVDDEPNLNEGVVAEVAALNKPPGLAEDGDAVDDDSGFLLLASTDSVDAVLNLKSPLVCDVVVELVVVVLDVVLGDDCLSALFVVAVVVAVLVDENDLKKLPLPLLKVDAGVVAAVATTLENDIGLSPPLPNEVDCV